MIGSHINFFFEWHFFSLFFLFFFLLLLVVFLIIKYKLFPFNNGRLANCWSRSSSTTPRSSTAQSTSSAWTERPSTATYSPKRMPILPWWTARRPMSTCRLLHSSGLDWKVIWRLRETGLSTQDQRFVLTALIAHSHDCAVDGCTDPLLKLQLPASRLNEP